MNSNFRGKDIINLRDMTPEEFRYLLDLAHFLKAEKRAGVDQHRYSGKNVAAQFEWGSTRTRCAFETSCNDLGMGFTYLSNSHVGLQETVKDTIRVFSEMYDVIVWRSQGSEKFMYEIAEYADIPVINALTTEDHPTQMLADALTLEEEWGGVGSCKGKKLAYAGACAISPLWYGRMCALMGMDCYVIGPDAADHQLRKSFVDELESMFKKYAPNNKLVISSDISLLKGMDVLTTEEWEYTNSSTSDDHGYDAWMSYAEDLIPYRLTSELMKVVDNPDAAILHMLPSLHNADHSLGQTLLSQAPNEEARKLINEGMEISDELFEKHARTIFREAGNRQHTIKATLAAVLGC
ncbi:MAG: ornithine carbamoyltransferase [Raoultibacter sp.]